MVRRAGDMGCDGWVVVGDDGCVADAAGWSVVGEDDVDEAMGAGGVGWGGLSALGGVAWGLPRPSA